MSRYATWAEEPPIYQKVNALGGTFDPNNHRDAGFDDALAACLELIEADPMVNAGADLLALAYQYRNDLKFPVEPDSRERRLAAIDAAIAKATGQ